jgi:hypothetical protein
MLSPLPTFTGRTIKEAPSVWMWGLVEKEKKRLANLLEAIVLLKRHGLHGIGVVEVYHARSAAPLMVHALPLYDMCLLCSSMARCSPRGRSVTSRSSSAQGDTGGVRCHLPGRGAPRDPARNWLRRPGKCLVTFSTSYDSSRFSYGPRGLGMAGALRWLLFLSRIIAGG